METAGCQVNERQPQQPQQFVGPYVIALLGVEDEPKKQVHTHGGKKVTNARGLYVADL